MQVDYFNPIMLLILASMQKKKKKKKTKVSFNDDTHWTKQKIFENNGSM